MSITSYFNKYNTKLKTAMISAIGIGSILIIYAFYSVFFKSNEKSNNYKNNLLNLTSYYAEYNLTVNSNKTKNMYSIKEWYKKSEEEKFKFEYNDFLNSKFNIIINGDKYLIKNMNQIAKYVSIRDKENGINIYSLSTYINIINSSAFEILKEETEVTYKYTINMSKIINESEAQKFKDILENEIKIDKVELLTTINRPIKLSIFSNNTERIIIDYTNFIINEMINDDVFEV